MTDLELQKKRDEAIGLFQKISPVFLSLGDRMRQQLIMDIALSGNQGIDAKELLCKNILSRAAVGYHLKNLKDSGLIYTIKKGTQVLYFLCIEETLPLVENLVQSLQTLCAEMQERKKKGL